MEDNNENNIKAKERAKIAMILLVVSICIPLVALIFIEQSFMFVCIAILISIPMYIIGLVLAIIARKTCDTCEYAKNVCKVYITSVIVLGVLILILILSFIKCVNSCKLDCDCGEVDSFCRAME
jgi:hypothetical protein